MRTMESFLMHVLTGPVPVLVYPFTSGRAILRVPKANLSIVLKETVTGMLVNYYPTVQGKPCYTAGVSTEFESEDDALRHIQDILQEATTPQQGNVVHLSAYRRG